MPRLGAAAGEAQRRPPRGGVENDRYGVGFVAGSVDRHAAALPSTIRALENPSLERKHLGGVEQPAGIEHSAHPHLLFEIGRVELIGHQVPLLDADAVLAGQAAADLDAQLQDILAGRFSAFSISPGLLALNMTSGWRLPSPAWNTLATPSP